MQYIHAALVCQSIMADYIHGTYIAQPYLKIWNHFGNPESMTGVRRRCAGANDKVIIFVTGRASIRDLWVEIQICIVHTYLL